MRQSLLITTAATLLLSGCITVYAGSGETINQNRDLPAFDQVEASRGVTVTLACGPVSKAVLHGEADPLIPLASGQRFAAAIPGAKLITYPKVGHLPQVEIPARSAADVVAFLDAPRTP